MLCLCSTRVKSGNFGHQVNWDIHLQIVNILMRRFSIIKILNKQCRSPNLADRPKLPDFTLHRTSWTLAGISLEKSRWR